MRHWLPVFLLLAASGAEAAPVDDFIRAEMVKRHIPGLSVAVLKSGKTLALSGYGIANLKTGASVTGQTVFKIASLSKAFIADSVLLLAQGGKLALEDHATKYLIDAPPAWQDITIRQLLNHTSGITRDPTDYHPYDAQPVMDVIRNAYALPLAATPGEKMLYSNIGYYVLAEVVSRVSGRPWDTYIAEHFFEPAGMAATRTTTGEIIPNRASGYHWADNRWIDAEDWIAVRPSGAFLSTAKDMARWETFQQSPQFPLNADRRAQAITLAHLNGGAASTYAFGWYVESFLGQARIHHDGQYPGFRADYEKFGDGLTVIALANDDNGGLEGLTLEIAGFYDSSLAAPAFDILASAPVTAKTGTPVAIAVSATAKDKAAPGSLVEMEIWDAAGKAVFKQHKADEDFGRGETRRLGFSWTPKAAGIYTVNVGAYGPKWVTSYAWSQRAATIKVN